MKFKVVVCLVLMAGIGSAAYADLVKRTVFARSGPGHSNPGGSISLDAQGSNVSGSNLKTAELSFSQSNSKGVSAYVNSSTWSGGGNSEADSGDISFQTLTGFTLTTTAARSLGYAAKIIPDDDPSQAVTDGGFPAKSGASANSIDAYNSTWTYAALTQAALSLAALHRSFTLQIWVFWDYQSNGSWWADGPFIYHFNYIPDTSAPVVSQTAPTGAGQWNAGGDPQWTLTAADDRGMASLSVQPQYSVDGSTYTNFGAPVVTTGTVTTASLSVTINPASLNGHADGAYRVVATAVNSDGLTSSVTSSFYGLDTHGPTFSTAPSAAYQPDGSVLVSWGEASDVSSGIGGDYQVSYSAAGGPAVPLKQAENSTTAAVLFAGANLGTSLLFTIQVSDEAGNTTSVMVSPSPPSLAVTAALGTAPDGQTMAVDLGFSLPPQELQAAFTGVQVTRTLPAPDPAGVTLAPLSLSTSSMLFDSSQILMPANGWSVDAQGRAHYQDLIPVGSGAGHRTWTYTPTSVPAAAGALAASLVTLPNHQGSVTVALADKNGNPYDPDHPELFQVGADGRVQVQLQGSDSDRDHWTYEIDRVGQISSSGGSLASYVRLSGATTTDYPYSGGYRQDSVPVTLQQGTNNLQVLWTEGDAGPFHSAIVSVTVTKAASGQFEIQVTTADGDVLPETAAIVTRPGEVLTFSLPDTGGLTYAWDFGDGTAPGNSAQVQHAYGQVVGQTGSSADHTVSVTASDGSSSQTVAVTVTVNDTQAGPLLTSETWRGDHMVTGVVEVTAGLSLTIVPSSDTPTAVTFSGSLGSGYGQGVVVDTSGTLSIGSGAVFRADSPQGWGSLDVRGTAVIGAADLQGASQAVVAEPGAAVTLVGTSLHDNQTALHVVGDGTSPSVAVTNATVTNNTVYGIKEDSGGRPLLSGTAVGGNFRNYYSFDRGLLTIDEINQLNAATPNTGDTTWGTDQ